MVETCLPLEESESASHSEVSSDPAKRESTSDSSKTSSLSDAKARNLSEESSSSSSFDRKEYVECLCEYYFFF